MASLNKVMLIGNLTRDAELRYLPSGQAVLEFRLAVNRKFRRQDGTDVDETCFVDVNFWGKRGEAVSQYLTKGKPLFVEGRLQLDEWDDKATGQKRSRMRVVAENIEFLGGGRGEAGTNGGGARQYHSRPAASGPDYPAGGPPRADDAATPPRQNGAPPRNEPYARPPAAAQAEPYARPASAPGVAVSAMHLAEDDIPF